MKKRPTFVIGNNRFIALHKYGVKIIIMSLILLPVLHVQGQPRAERKIECREAALERKERRDYKKRREAVLKHRYSIQTKEVQERMKESKKKADRFNNLGDKPFYKNLFKKKKRKKKKNTSP